MDRFVVQLAHDFRVRLSQIVAENTYIRVSQDAANADMGVASGVQVTKVDCGCFQ